MRKQRRIGLWLLWGGLVLFGASFGACSGLSLSPPWLSVLLWAAMLGLASALVGGVLVATARR